MNLQGVRPQLTLEGRLEDPSVLLGTMAKTIPVTSRCHGAHEGLLPKAHLR